MTLISQTRAGVPLTGVKKAQPGATPRRRTRDQCNEQDKRSVQLADIVKKSHSIAAAIIRSDARAVSDGSPENTSVLGTSARILFLTKSKDPQHIIRISSLPGNKEEQSVGIRDQTRAWRL
jgi:hypothetical protein